MRIALDVECLQSGRAGIATVVQNLRRDLQRIHPDVLLYDYPKSRAPKTFLRRTLNALRHLFYILVELPRRLRRDGVDVLIGPAFYVPLWMPRGCRSIVIVYDLIPMTHPRGQDGLNAIYRNTLGRLCAKRADHVVTLSHYTRREISRILGIPLSRITVARAAATDYWRPAPQDERKTAMARFGLSRRGYFLFTGANDPRKNIRTLLHAHARCLRRQEDFPLLVIAGGAGATRDAHTRLAERLGTATRVLFTGYVSQETLRALYSEALAFVFPSLSEGFGLPVLEAM